MPAWRRTGAVGAAHAGLEFVPQPVSCATARAAGRWRFGIGADGCAHDLVFVAAGPQVSRPADHAPNVPVRWLLPSAAIGAGTQLPARYSSAPSAHDGGRPSSSMAGVDGNRYDPASVGAGTSASMTLRGAGGRVGERHLYDCSEWQALLSLSARLR